MLERGELPSNAVGMLERRGQPGVERRGARHEKGERAREGEEAL